MAITSKFDKFYDEGGGGANAPGAALLAQAKEMKDQDKGEGHKTLLADRVMGPFMVNLQHAHDDINSISTFVQDEDEILNVVKATFPSGCVWHPAAGRWIIPITRTEWIGGFEEIGKGGGATWGFVKAAYGARDQMVGRMWV